MAIVDPVIRDPVRKIREIINALNHRLTFADNFAAEGLVGQVATSRGTSGAPYFAEPTDGGGDCSALDASNLVTGVVPAARLVGEYPDAIVDHGTARGLGDDDHLQYLRTDGARAGTGNLTIYPYTFTAGSIQGMTFTGTAGDVVFYAEALSGGRRYFRAVQTAAPNVLNGIGLQFQLQGPDTFEKYGQIVAISSGITSGQEEGTLIISVMYAGTLTDVIEITGCAVKFGGVVPAVSGTAIAERHSPLILANGSDALYGVFADPIFNIPTGLTATIFGWVFRGQKTGPGTAAVAYLAYIEDLAAGAATTVHGLYIASIDSGSTNYAIYTNDGLVHFGDHVDLASGKVYKVNAVQVVGAQGTAVADATGGSVIDVEARAALNALLARCRTHGLIAT